MVGMSFTLEKDSQERLRSGDTNNIEVKLYDQICIWGGEKIQSFCHRLYNIYYRGCWNCLKCGVPWVVSAPEERLSPIIQSRMWLDKLFSNQIFSLLIQVRGDCDILPSFSQWFGSGVLGFPSKSCIIISYIKPGPSRCCIRKTNNQILICQYLGQTKQFWYYGVLLNWCQEIPVV